PADVHWVLLSMLITAVACMPLWLRLSRHFEKHSMFVAGSIWFAICLVGVSVANPGWPYWGIFVLAALIGIGYAAVDLMPWAMVGEVIDQDALETGVPREGLYNGVLTFVRKVAGATAYMFAGIGMSLAGYDQALSEQPPAALLTIRGLASLAPCAFILLGLVAALRYPLTRAKHSEIRAALALRLSPENER
ncbi:MAG: MFS transporter, partial [Myxococcota bacterium]